MRPLSAESALYEDAAVERRAARIADPVARLRFLRRMHGAPRPRRPSQAPWIAAGFAAVGLIWLMTSLAPPLNIAPPLPAAASQALMPDFAPHAAAVWVVERTAAYEQYSNGLRVELAYETRTHARRPFAVMAVSGPAFRVVGWRNEPNGIVFHTTESDVVPIEAANRDALERIGESTLAAVRQGHCYHYLIDRFGRVFRIVAESDVAYHAGRSVWGTPEAFYVNLNGSFLGVAFESSTSAGAPATTAQLNAGRALTEMLRARYGIAAENCVTHAQVSVNPGAALIGFHTDWGASFPFAALGLPDNYAIPPASIALFGFRHDAAFDAALRGRTWPGVAVAELQVRAGAAASGLPMNTHRTALARRARSLITALHAHSFEKEGIDEKR